MDCAPSPCVREQGGAGGPGGFGGLGGGGPMDFGRNKSKFQEVPETGVTFDDVAVWLRHCVQLAVAICAFLRGHEEPSVRMVMADA